MNIRSLLSFNITHLTHPASSLQLDITTWGLYLDEPDRETDIPTLLIKRRYSPCVINAIIYHQTRTEEPRLLATGFIPTPRSPRKRTTWSIILD